MAEAKKTTKRSAPKTEISLIEQVAQKRKDLLDAKKSHKAGELVNPRVLGEFRKDIARIMTKLNANTSPKVNPKDEPKEEAK